MTIVWKIKLEMDTSEAEEALSQLEEASESEDEGHSDLAGLGNITRAALNRRGLG